MVIGKLRRAGNSLVVTIPPDEVARLGLRPARGRERATDARIHPESRRRSVRGDVQLEPTPRPSGCSVHADDSLTRPLDAAAGAETGANVKDCMPPGWLTV